MQSTILIFSVRPSSFFLDVIPLSQDANALHFPTWWNHTASLWFALHGALTGAAGVLIRSGHSRVFSPPLTHCSVCRRCGRGQRWKEARRTLWITMCLGRVGSVQALQAPFLFSFCLNKRRTGALKTSHAADLFSFFFVSCSWMWVACFFCFFLASDVTRVQPASSLGERITE